MSKKDDGGAAFPAAYRAIGAERGEAGMSLRDWLAGQMLAGAAAGMGNSQLEKDINETVESALRRYWSDVAIAAYIAADAMLAERAK